MKCTSLVLKIKTNHETVMIPTFFDFVWGRRLLRMRSISVFSSTHKHSQIMSSAFILILTEASVSHIQFCKQAITFIVYTSRIHFHNPVLFSTTFLSFFHSFFCFFFLQNSGIHWTRFRGWNRETIKRGIHDRQMDQKECAHEKDEILKPSCGIFYRCVVLTRHIFTKRIISF